MTSFNITGSSNTARILTGSESGLIGAQATLSVSGSTAISMSGGSNKLVAAGSILSGNFTAVSVSGGASLTFGQNATVMSGAAFAVMLQPIVSATWNFANAGTIIGAGNGIGWNSLSNDVNVALNAVNTGTIVGAAGSGFSVYASLASELHNSGEITGNAIGVDFSSTTGTNIAVKNSGEMAGTLISYLGGLGNDLIDNAGLLNGNVDLNPGHDTLLNTGSVLGDFDGGQGDDFFDGRFGLITGAVQGGAGSDTLIGGAGDEALLGGADNDTLTGNGGADTLSGEVGEDRLEGGAGDDQLSGGSQSDRLKGGPGDDIFDGGTNFDTAIYSGIYAAVRIELENGLATGGAGTDTLIGIEHAFGSAANDTIYGTNLHGNRLEGSLGRDTIFGLDGDDTILGGDSHDSLLGGAGDDLILGGGHDDYLDGGRDADKLSGGSGADNFVFRAIADMGVGATLRDQILDFDPLEGDVVNLFLIDANTTIAGNQAFVVRNAYSGAGSEMVLFDFTVSGKDVTVASLDVDGDSTTDAQIYIVGGADAGDFVL